MSTLLRSLYKTPKAFKLTGGKSRKVKLPSDRVPVLKKGDETGPYFIRGMKAESRDEYWVALALDKIAEDTGWAWEYQVPVYGGREFRGGNVVDFLVHTPMQYTVLDPMGAYWHTGKNYDLNQMQEVARRKGWRLVAWFTDETPTAESVLSYLKRELHV